PRRVTPRWGRQEAVVGVDADEISRVGERAGDVPCDRDSRVSARGKPGIGNRQGAGPEAAIGDAGDVPVDPDRAEQSEAARDLNVVMALQSGPVVRPDAEVLAQANSHSFEDAGGLSKGTWFF